MENSRPHTVTHASKATRSHSSDRTDTWPRAAPYTTATPYWATFETCPRLRRVTGPRMAGETGDCLGAEAEVGHPEDPGVRDEPEMGGRAVEHAEIGVVRRRLTDTTFVHSNVNEDNQIWGQA